MSKGLRNNEELVKLYKESRNEEYLAELISQNTGLINILVSSYLSSIPNSELEDLVSESYIPMLKAIEDFDEKQGFSFSTLLKAYVRQHLNRLYNEAMNEYAKTYGPLTISHVRNCDTYWDWVNQPWPWQ